MESLGRCFQSGEWCRVGGWDKGSSALMLLMLLVPSGMVQRIPGGNLREDSDVNIHRHSVAVILLCF